MVIQNDNPFVEFILSKPGEKILTNGRTCITKELNNMYTVIETWIREAEVEKKITEEQFKILLKTISYKEYQCLPTEKWIWTNNSASAVVIK